VSDRGPARLTACLPGDRRRAVRRDEPFGDARSGRSEARVGRASVPATPGEVHRAVDQKERQRPAHSGQSVPPMQAPRSLNQVEIRVALSLRKSRLRPRAGFLAPGRRSFKSELSGVDLADLNGRPPTGRWRRDRSDPTVGYATRESRVRIRPLPSGRLLLSRVVGPRKRLFTHLGERSLRGSPELTRGS
jgi:hypothetical protein